MTVTKILEQTLSSGATSVSFTDADIPNSLIRVYSSNADIIPVSRNLTGNTLTVVYEPQSNNIDVAVEIVKAGLDIVDDLTSTDTDKALSAKQGKVLKDSIDTTNGNLSDLATVVDNLDIPDNITDLDDVTVSDIQSGQVLAWDGTKFVNVDQSGGGSGIDYSTSEQDTGLLWIDGRHIYQKTVNFGSLPNANSKTVAHNISNLGFIIRYEGTAHSSSYSIPIPYIHSSNTSANVELYFNNTYIHINTSMDRTSYTECYITLLYVKSA